MLELNLIFSSMWRRRGLFALWLASLSMAVSGLLVVDVYRQSLTYTLHMQGRKIMAGDLSVSARRPLTDAERATFVAALPKNASLSDLTEMFAMVAHQQEGVMHTRLASLRFIDDTYPLYGDLQIRRGEQIVSGNGAQLGAAPDAWIAEDFMTLLGLKPGDELKIGKQNFRVTAFLHKDPSQTFRIGNMAPRIYLHQNYLKPTGLIQFGSTYTQSLITKLAQDEPQLKNKLEKLFVDPAIQITVPADLEQGPFRVMSRLLDYLGLTGLVTLTLGWIGVYYLGRRWLNLETMPAGLLKCMGFSAGKLRRLLALKLFIILSLGVAIGGLLAWIAAWGLLPQIKYSLPEEFSLQWSWTSTLLLLVVGPLSGWLLLLPAIGSLATDSPLNLVLRVFSPRPRPREILSFALATAVLFILVTLAQARSWRVTLIFFASLLGTVAVIAGLGYLWLRWARWRQTRSSGWLMHLTLSLWARRQSMALLLISVSALAGLLSQLIPSLEKTLLNELLAPQPQERPGLFLFDVQDEQLKPLEHLLASKSIAVSQSAPMIRARILKVNGQDFERSQISGWNTREQEMDARMRNRGVNLSFRDQPALEETVVEGKPWNKLARNEISVEKGYAERLHLHVGDTLHFDVQGVELDASVGNLRDVNWDSFEPNFFIMFPRGVLDEAPKTWIVTVKRTPGTTPAQVQGMINEQFPSVTSLNVQEVLDNAADLFGKLAAGLRLASALCLVLGVGVFLMILLFQIASSQTDSVQLKTLGLRRAEVVRLQSTTYGGLALVGNLIGGAVSLAMAWSLAHFAFSSHLEVDWSMMGAITLVSLTAAGLGVVLLSRYYARHVTLGEDNG